jgi:two-component system chemotaxis response regulator CheY
MAESKTVTAESTNPGFIPTKVLIADDQGVIRSSIRRVLEKMGPFEIFEFSNGNSSIEFMKKHPIDLVIADIYMPKGDGFDLLNYVRTRPMGNDIPVIFVSGEATKDDIVHAIDLKVTDYIIKPFEPADLSQKIQQVLSRYQHPTAWEQEMRKAESFYLNGDVDAAAKLFQAAISKGDQSPRAYAGLAQCFLHVGDRTQAVNHLQQAIKTNGLYFPAYALLADLYSSTGNSEKAKEMLLKELSINGKQPHRRMMLAKIYTSEGTPEKAIEEMRKALIDSPKDEQSLLYAANLFGDQGNLEKAIHYFVRTRKNHPDCYAALQGIIDYCSKLDALKKAEHLFKDLVRLNPKQRDLFLARSRVYELQQNYDAALEDIEIYLADFPDHVEGLKQAVRILTQLKRFDAALARQITVVELAPSAENFARAGITCLRSQQFAAAAGYYEKAVGLDSQDKTYCFNLGYALEMTQNLAKARLCYKRVLEIAPGNSDAVTALQRVEQLLKAAQALKAQQQPSQTEGNRPSRHFTGGHEEEYPAVGSSSTPSNLPKKSES